MKNIFPESRENGDLASGFTEKDLENLITDADYLDENNLSFKVVVMKWKPFKNVIGESEHNLKRVESDKSEIKRTHLDLKNIDGLIGINQTTFSSEYKLRNRQHRYGFRKISCKDCGREKLFFDQKEEMYYCPVCECG